jgi:hypothetical protein
MWKLRIKSGFEFLPSGGTVVAPSSSHEAITRDLLAAKMIRRSLARTNCGQTADTTKFREKPKINQIHRVQKSDVQTLLI